MGAILVVGCSPAMKTLIYRILTARGYELNVVSETVKAVEMLRSHPEIKLVITFMFSEPAAFKDATGVALPVIVVYPETGPRRSRQMRLSLTPPCVVALKWPFFPADLVSAITLCKL